MNVAALIRILGAKGMSAADIADVVELAMPAVPSREERKRERDRDRVAAKREQERLSQESRDSGDIARQGDTLSEGSQGSPEPLPNPPNLSQVPPIVPQKSARKAKAEPPKGAFAAFWADYPLKVGKLAAEKAYPRAWARQLEENPEVAPEAEILAGLGRCKAKWDPDFIPNPLTFLNQGRWMDVPEPDLPDSATGPPKFDLAAFEAKRSAREREHAA